MTTSITAGTLPKEYEDLRDTVAEFARTVVAPVSAKHDEEHSFPYEVVAKMADMGLFGLPFPEEYGGSGSDFTTMCLVIEELARIDSSMAVTVEAGVGLGANPIYQFGTEQQRQRWLPDLCAGRALGAFGLTEPDAGSDAGATRTRAILDPATDEWVIDGTKAFITNSGTPITSVITLTARAPEGIAAILVPAGTPGLVVEPPYRKMGWHASDTHGLRLENCRVPSANLLGEAGRGFAQFLAILDDGRVAIAALAVGLAQACLEHSVAYAGQRNAFGGPIGRYQAVAFKCADMAVAVAAARSLVYRAAWLKDHGRSFKQEAAMAKLYATEAAVTATREATQIFGGYGFMDETPVSRFYRDAKILEIGEGTSEVQRLLLARGLGLPV
jgi:alkylation response protein AidB-like acyl-CoA dehydrogenase